MEIFFCDKCGSRISPGDADSGKAVIGEESCYCPRCATELGIKGSGTTKKRIGGSGARAKIATAVTRAMPGDARADARGGARGPARGDRRETRRAPAPAGGAGKVIALGVGAAVLGFIAIAVFMGSGEPEPPRSASRRPAPEPAPAPAPAPEKKPDAPKSLLSTIKPGGSGEDPTSIFGHLSKRTDTPEEKPTPEPAPEPAPAPPPPPPPPPQPERGTAEKYGPGPAPPGYAMPAGAIYKEDFENGRGGWERAARIVDGGIGGSKKCAVTDGRTVSKWLPTYTFTAQTRIRFACYIPADGGARSFQLMCWDTTARDNVRVAYRNLERDKWHVFDVGPQDFFRWNSSEKPEGHQLKSLGIFPDSNAGKVAFDDFVIYERGAGGAAAPAAPAGGAAEESYSGASTPPGYSVPADTVVKFDFESGDRMKWLNVRTAKGGPGSSRHCAVHTGDGTAQVYDAKFKITASTVMQAAVYLPPDRDNTWVQLRAWDATLKKNLFRDFNRLEKGKWLVLKVRPGDWYNEEVKGSVVGHECDSVKIYARQGNVVAFDDVVVYEERAQTSPATRPMRR